MEYAGFNWNFDLCGKSAVVVGAAKEPGRAIACALAHKGASVLLCDTDESILHIADALCIAGFHALGLVCDLSDRERVDGIAAAAVEAFGGVDILVNAEERDLLRAGVNVTSQEWDALIETDLTLPFRISRRIGKQMIEQGRGGRIIHIASKTATVPVAGHSVYAAAKAGVVHMTHLLAMEWGKYGITVNAISPGAVRGVDDCAQTMTEQEARRLVPLGRRIEPDEIAATVVFLASDAAGMISGANIAVDGGPDFPPAVE